MVTSRGMTKALFLYIVSQCLEIGLVIINVRTTRLPSTRLLRHVLNIQWKQHFTNQVLYAGLPRVSERVKNRRLRLAGHCRRSNEAGTNVVLWKPKHGYTSPGRPAPDCATILSENTELWLGELNTTMNDRETWRSFIKGSGVLPMDDEDEQWGYDKVSGHCSITVAFQCPKIFHLVIGQKDKKMKQNDS